MRMIRSSRAVFFAVLVAFVMLAASTASFGQVAISVSFGPPALPIYEQPICPGEGYIWTPGYWAWDPDDEDYYWVPGTWVLAPEVGFLWTPPWWGWSDGVYLFHEGWWGPHVGFYGGVVYGFGYFGEGFVGGRWDHDRFFYNRSVTNINVVNIHNVYNENVNVTNVNHVSYNGGPGGIQARPRPEEERADRERHLPPVAAQTQHFQEARSNRELHASANHGRPPIAATDRPGQFRGNVVPAREAGGAYNPPANRGGNRGNPARRENAPSRNVVHPNELPPLERPARPNTGNPKLDQKYQQQQEKLFNKQNQERQRLQQRQEQEHQRLAQQNANEGRRQQMEQRHQQQTQQMHEQHIQQQQHLQQRQQPPPSRHR
jgi:WXXGXW repeat (2 copies)